MQEKSQLIKKITNNCMEIEDKTEEFRKSTSNLHIKKSLQRAKLEIELTFG
jgi:hypothetical protein